MRKNSLKKGLILAIIAGVLFCSEGFDKVSASEERLTPLSEKQFTAEEMDHLVEDIDPEEIYKITKKLQAGTQKEYILEIIKKYPEVKTILESEYQVSVD